MKYKQIAESLFENAENLNKESSMHEEASNKYTEDLGVWGIKVNKIEQLKKELEKTTVELKAYGHDKIEFPTLDNSFFELGLASNFQNKKKVLDILKKYDAFELEKFHVANLEERVKRVNSALSLHTKNKRFVSDKDNNPFSKNNIVKIFKYIGAEKIEANDKGKGKISYTFVLNDIPMFGISSTEFERAIVSYKPIKE